MNNLQEQLQPIKDKSHQYTMSRYVPYPAYKDSGVEWLGEIPEEWAIPALKWYISIASGEGLSNNDIEPVPDINNIYKVIGGNGVLGYSTKKNTVSKVFSIGRVGALCGNIHFLDEPCWITDNSLKVSSWRKLIDNYMYYMLLAANLNNYANRSAQPLITGGQVKALKIPFPPLQEQQTIANYLDKATAKIDTLIEKQTRLIELLKEKRQAVISTAVTRGLDSTVAMKDSGVEWLGEIPEHWEVKKLKYIGQAIIGLTYSPSNIVDEYEGTLVLRSSNLQNGGLYYGDNVYVNSDIPDKLITKSGDIVICSRNGSRKLIGKNAMINKDSAGVSFGAFTSVFRSNQNPFVFYILNSSLFKYQSGRFMTTTINQLTTGTLNEFQIALPPENEQSEIVKYLVSKTSKIDTLVTTAEKAIDLLKEKRTALISAAVTGKIDVRKINMENT